MNKTELIRQIRIFIDDELIHSLKYKNRIITIRNRPLTNAQRQKKYREKRK